MRASFLIKEMIYNSICAGKLMYENEGDKDPKIIDYIKCTPRSSNLQIHFTDGTTVANANENSLFTFEVNKKRVWKKATRRQIQQSKSNK